MGKNGAVEWLPEEAHVMVDEERNLGCRDHPAGDTAAGVVACAAAGVVADPFDLATYSAFVVASVAAEEAE